MSAQALRLHAYGERLTPGLVFAAWRGITREQFAATFLLGCALFVYHLVLDMLGEAAAELAVHFALEQIKAFSMLLAFVVADRVTGSDPDRRGAYAIAVAAGAAAGGAAIGSVGPVASALLFGADASPSAGFAIYIGLEQFMLGSAAVLVINDRRRARRASEILHRAEIDRIAAEKRSVESDLQAMQARVEPQFLFNTLAQVERLYAEDPLRGARMLDDLIAYLRAAMPLMRETSSTFGREIALARAYLDIVRLRFGDRLGVDIEAPPDADDIRMPPMMLLPLIDHAVVHGLEEAATGSGAIRIRGAVQDGRLRLTICDSGVGFAPEADGAGIAALRERLDALYGQAAWLELRRADRRSTEAVLELPLESRDSADARPPSNDGATR